MSKQKQEQDVQPEETAEAENTAQAQNRESNPEAEGTPIETETEVNQKEATTSETAAVDWQAKYNELNDRYLRMAAEYDNFRKRSQREREKAHSDAVSHAVTALLPTFDNLERALQAETTDTEYKKGVELTMTQLTKSLNELGVTPIASEPGTTFDPKLHNAMMHVDDDTLAENVIAEVFQKGFRIGDKVIRYAMVKVAN